MKHLFYNQKTVSRQLNRECLSPDSITSVRFLSKTSETKTCLSFRSHLVSLSERGIDLFILSTFETSCTSSLRVSPLCLYWVETRDIKDGFTCNIQAMPSYCFRIADFFINGFWPCVVSSLLSVKSNINYI